MKKNKNYLLFIVWVFIFLVALAVFATSVVACTKYGGAPITEIPAWALMFMFGRK